MLGRKLKTISVKLPKEVVELMDTLVKNGEYYSKSQIVRRALLEFLKNKANTSSMQEQKVQRAIRALEAVTY